MISCLAACLISMGGIVAFFGYGLALIEFAMRNDPDPLNPPIAQPLFLCIGTIGFLSFIGGLYLMHAWV